MRYTRISADCHIDLPWLPPDLFTANASAVMKDRMPYVVEGPDGLQWTTKKGAPFGLVGGIGSTGTKYVPGQNHRVDVMATSRSSSAICRPTWSTRSPARTPGSSTA